MWLFSTAVSPIDVTIRRPQLGGTAFVSFGAATGQTTSTEQRLGLGLAGSLDFNVNAANFSLIATVARSPLVALQPGGDSREICNEGYFPNLIKMPGACVQYQARFLVVWQRYYLKPGLAYSYNYQSDLSYKGSRIYNTEWAYHAIAPTVMVALPGLTARWQALAYLSFDVGVSSVTLTGQKIGAWQILMGVYGFYAL